MSRWVLLHGFLGAPGAWDATRAALPGPTLAPALAGHGGPAQVAGWDAEVDRLAAQIAGWDAPRHLVGYSLGGRLALGLLVRHPDLWSQVTLVSASAGLSDPIERAARRAADAQWAARLHDEGLERFLDAWEAQPIFASQAALPAPTRAAWRALRVHHDADALAVGLGPLSLGAMPDYTGALSEIHRPVRVVTGALDPKFCALGAQMCTLLPRGQQVILPGAGHNLPLEAPEALARALCWSPDEPS